MRDPRAASPVTPGGSLLVEDLEHLPDVVVKPVRVRPQPSRRLNAVVDEGHPPQPRHQGIDSLVVELGKEPLLPIGVPLLQDGSDDRAGLGSRLLLANVHDEADAVQGRQASAEACLPVDQCDPHGLARAEEGVAQVEVAVGAGKLPLRSAQLRTRPVGHGLETPSHARRPHGPVTPRGDRICLLRRHQGPHCRRSVQVRDRLRNQCRCLEDIKSSLAHRPARQSGLHRDDITPNVAQRERCCGAKGGAVAQGVTYGQGCRRCALQPDTLRSAGHAHDETLASLLMAEHGDSCIRARIGDRIDDPARRRPAQLAEPLIHERQVGGDGCRAPPEPAFGRDRSKHGRCAPRAPDQRHGPPPGPWNVMACPGCG